MDAFDAPASFIATIIAFSVIAYVRHLRRLDDAEGKPRKREETFAFLAAVPGLALWFFFIDHPFWGDFLMTLLGMFLASVLVLLAGSLRRFLSRESPPK